MNKEIKQQKPIIEDYLDYRDFLRDYYDFKKSSEKFSYQLWANELKITSKGYLRLLVAGKRPLSSELLSNFSSYFKFNKREKEFFINLVQFNQAKNLETRSLFFSKLKANQKLNRRWINNTYDYLSDEWMSRIHVLLGQEGIEKTPEALSKDLKLSLKKVLGLLNKLKKLGIADHNENQWYAKDTVNSVPDQINDMAVQSFHKKSLEKAIQSIDSDPKDRHLNATYFVIPEDELGQIREKINDFSGSLLAEYGNKEIKPDQKSKLYQININAIPMSDQLIHSQSECAKGSSTLLETLGGTNP